MTSDGNIGYMLKAVVMDTSPSMTMLVSPAHFVILGAEDEITRAR